MLKTDSKEGNTASQMTKQVSFVIQPSTVENDMTKSAVLTKKMKSTSHRHNTTDNFAQQALIKVQNLWFDPIKKPKKYNIRQIVPQPSLMGLTRMHQRVQA